MNSSKGPGFAVLYRWRLHPGKEEQFIEAWARVSERLLQERGSLGSRLHSGPGGIWYSYAQWPSSDARDLAFTLPPIDATARERMRDATTESFPELVLESVADYMVLPTGRRGEVKLSGEYRALRC
jgi:heme-degrading monooxygenase HmoA